MYLCGRCGKETSSKFLVRQLGMLCYECAEEYTRKESLKLEEEITELRTQQNYLRKELNDSCPHENGLIETGYGTVKNEKLISFHRCKDCGEMIEKEGLK